MTMPSPRRLALATSATLALCVPLAACGGQAAGLIPTADAGPLESDFEAVARAAQAGNCTATERALEQTRGDFEKLPSARVSAALQARLEKGIANLEKVARTRCQQRTTTTTTTSHSSARSTTTALSIESSAPETSTSIASTATSRPAPLQTGPPGGGTQAPEGGAEGGAEAEGAGGGAAHDGGPGGEGAARSEHGSARPGSGEGGG